MSLRDFALRCAIPLCRHPKAASFVKSLAEKTSPKSVISLDDPLIPEQRTSVISLDYPLILEQRWKTFNPHLYDLLDKGRDTYRAKLQSFLTLLPDLLCIPEHLSTEQSEPCWINGWMPPLDGVALYCLLVQNNPKLFLEIGSGNSTKFARKAITDHGLRTKI